MVGVSAAPSRSWSHGRAIDHFRCLPRPHGERGRVPARGAMAALHGAFLSDVFSHVPTTKVREVSHMLKAIHAQESRDAADRKARAIVDDLCAARMNTAADLVERSVSETLTYYAFPDIHWQKIRTNNPLERIMREISSADPCRWSVP